MSEQGGPAPRGLAKADKLRLAALVVMTGFAVAVSVHYVYGAYCGYRYPYSTYLHRPADSFEVGVAATTLHDFSDLLAACIHVENRDPYFAEIPHPYSYPQYFASNYFPFGAMLPYPLTLIPYPLAVGLFVAGFVAFLAWFNWTFMRTGDRLADAIPIVALTLMNYPAQVVVDRGNTEAFVFAFVAGFTMLLVRRRADWSAGLLGAAIAMKAAPVVFLPLCHRVAGRRGVVVALAAAFLLTAGSLLVMSRPVHVNVLRFRENLGTYAKATSQDIDPANHASGLYGLIVLGDWTSQLTPAVRPVWGLLKFAYPAIAAVILVVAMLLSVWLPLRLWELATAAAVCLVLLPSASPDYRLIHMLIPFALFVNSRTPRREGIVTTLLFALLFVPKSWVIIAREVSLNSALNPLILLALLVRTLHGANARRLEAGGVAAAHPAAATRSAAISVEPSSRRRKQ
jgi:hypothetical protein